MRLFNTLLIVLFLTFSVNSFASKPKHRFARIKTSKGECIVLLYNSTPKHRDNFIKLAQTGYYNGTLFHRVIKDFMIQGGDPDSKNAAPDQQLGEGGPSYRIEAEFQPNLFHKKGALAAARDNNPEKASSGSQFYLVQGIKFTDERLDQLETQRLGRKLPAEHRQAYKSIGGAPHLDQSYTVYGEVVEGLDMIANIASVPTGASNRPVEDIRMDITLLKKKSARKLEKKYNLAERP